MPEREKKQVRNISPSDAVLSHIETRDIIDLQCKSVSLQIGHPITSNAASNDTLKALIELDKIIMSLYILDYVDDEEMRKCVHRSLKIAGNRIINLDLLFQRLVVRN